jgi:ssDNA-binding Zn-finger/Zn-ribbon topoisomerase 1
MSLAYAICPKDNTKMRMIYCYVCPKCNRIYQRKLEEIKKKD